MIVQITPLLGYLASLCLIVALLVNNDLKFRWFNTFGNIFFIAYALVLGAFPILLTNLILFGINIIYLVKVYRRIENFDLLEFEGKEKLVQKFLQFYQNDIASYFPEFKTEAMETNLNFVVIRDLVIANMFSASISAEGDATVLLNYTLQKYRDFKVGSFIFEKEKDYLISKGIKRIVYKKVYHKKHEKFLLVSGFKKMPIDGTGCFVKNLLDS